MGGWQKSGRGRQKKVESKKKVTTKKEVQKNPTQRQKNMGGRQKSGRGRQKKVESKKKKKKSQGKNGEFPRFLELERGRHLVFSKLPSDTNMAFLHFGSGRS
jgi:hypothetical protein